jgi:hypothetical protein
VRIAYIGNFRHPFCTEVHVTGSLKSLGHEVIPLQEDRLDFASLASRVKKNAIELLLWTRTWEVDHRKAFAALEKIRDAGVPSVSFHLDRFHGLEREPLIESEPFFRTDLLVSPDAGPWHDYGVNAMWLPPGVYGPEAREQYMPLIRRFPHRVVFVGSHPYPHKEWRPYRTAVIERMRKEFGDDFAVWPQHGAIRGRQLGMLYATAEVVVGDSCLVGNPSHYWSDRIPETIGRGGFLVHPNVPGLDDWYPPDTFARYELGDLDGLVDIVRDALDNRARARAIAAAGRSFAVAHDTYEERLRTVLNEGKTSDGRRIASP